jgi:hypothetical protein
VKKNEELKDVVLPVTERKHQSSYIRASTP